MVSIRVWESLRGGFGGHYSAATDTYSDKVGKDHIMDGKPYVPAMHWKEVLISLFLFWIDSLASALLFGG